MSFYKNLLLSIPEIKDPEKKLSLKTKLAWTAGILVLFLFLATIPLYGISADKASYFQHLELMLGAKIGKLLTLGIGPIVMSSIVLQLLKGSGILNFNMNTEDGKLLYTGTHKLLTFAFVILEAIVYVGFGAVGAASPELFWVVVLQLALGGFIVFYMDEVVKKWGMGSGVSLFIAAGIGQAVFIQIFSPFNIDGVFAVTNAGAPPVGKFFQFFLFLQAGDLSSLLTSVIGPVGITVALFFLIVFFQSINVEIPLSFGRVRGQSMKWPLNFFYSGVIPIILISALGANLNLWSMFWERFRNLETGSSFLSTIVSYIQPIRLWDNLGNFFTLDVWPHMLSYLIYMVVGSTVFAYFWVKTSGMDSHSQAKQILSSGLQIPGFRKDARIIERVLNRYIAPLTIMGGIGIGVLAVSADLLSALTSGTGILLLVMIIYQFYQTLARESMDDFSLLRKFMKK